MDGKRTYQIVINGLQESIDAVKSLEKQLSNLEERIKSIEKSNVKINTSSSITSGSKSSSSLSEEEKLAKQIEQIDAKREVYSKEIYQNYLAAKDVLNETVNDQKQLAAAERIQADTYSNTMDGIKQKLADLKSVHFKTDLSSDEFKKQTQEINTLTEKLKKLEEEYGVYSRNVGNYANGVAEGLQKITVNVGGVERTFNNAREASRTLGNELKAMAINGQQGTKAFKDMQVAVAKLNSEIKDATVSSKAMDNLLDTMQSFTAIGSVTQGISALFGFDNDEIQRSIQKLVALQNVMQGIEKINQQINSAEGIGAWLAKGNSMIDSFVAKLTGAANAQKELNTATTAGVTASKAITTAQEAQAVATTTATVATKALGAALKALGIGLIIAAVASLVEYWDDLKDILTDTVPELKNISVWLDKIKAITVGVGTAVINHLVQPFVTLGKTIQAIINGNFSEIPKILAEGFKKTFDYVGNYQKGYNKEIERQQRVHNDKMLKAQKDTNDDWIKDEEAKYGKSYQNTKKYLDNQMQLVTKQLANAKKGSKEYDELIKEQKEIQRKIWENERTEKEKNAKKSKELAKKNAKEEAEVEKDLANLRIANMKEGLNKVLKQLEEERKQRLAKVEADGRLIAERQAEINILYDKKILDAKKEWAEKVEKTYKDMWDNIYNYSYELTKKIENLATRKYELGVQNMDYIKDTEFNIPDYGVQGIGQLSKSTKEDLKIEENTNKELAKIYADRRKIINDYWLEREKFETSTTEEIYQAQIRVENKEYEKQKREREKNWNEQQKLQSEWYDERREQAKGLAEQEKWSQKELDLELINIEKEYHKAATLLFQAYTIDEKEIEMQHAQNLEKIEQEKVNKIRNINMESYRQRLQELRDFQTAISNLESKQPVYNIFGITNFKQTNANYRILLDSYKKQADEIIDLKKELQEKLDKQEITFDDFQNANRELDTFVDNLGQKMDEVKYKLSIGGQIEQFIQDIQQYIQVASQSFQQIMSAVWDYQDYLLEKEQKELDDYNDLLDKKLEKQQEIVEKHKDAIDSIEDELADARGSRRQHLIDQLNAEMQAQREAAAQEKKIKKEQEAAEKKQEQLDKKRREQEYKRNVMQAFVSWHLGVANALATQPFMPVGIAMGALATALGAVQYALVKSQKPYAKGGLLEGPSHKQGGIPVGNTGIEVEGKEYVVRKKSTAQNIDLLDYINRSERKLDLSDFISFYASDKPRKVINGMKAKFEDGGTLPTTLDVRDQLQNIVINQDNRPIYVSVVDINNKQEDVRRVQTLAGL